MAPVDKVVHVISRWGWCAAIAVLATSLVAPVTPSAAHEAPQSTADARDRQADIAAELERLEDQLDEAAAEEAHILAELNAARARRDELARQVGALDEQIAVIEAELVEAQAELDDAQARYLAGREALRRAEAELRESKRTLRTQAVEAYTGGGGLGVLTDALFSAQSLNELNASATYLESVLDAQAEVVDHHVEVKADMAELADLLDGIKEQALAIRNDVVAHRSEVAHARAEMTELRAAAVAEAEREAELLAQAQGQRAEYERRKDDLTRESSSIASFLRQRQSQQTVVSHGDGSLAWPISGARITSYYGVRRHPIFGTERLHAGLDFAGSHGTPVGAAGAGEVLYVGWRGGYGNAVIIDHGGGLATLYAHLSSITISDGETVGVGTTIGRVGSTGYSTGPHLHFETRVGGNPVDPLQFL